MTRLVCLLVTLTAALSSADPLPWIRAHAIPLRSVEAGQGFADLQPLKKVVGDARIVSLGEATHGTREFFQLKHRMLEFLATEMGFTIFSIEANMPEAYRLNEYVLTGKGDPAELLTGLYFWTWNTEEVLAMIRWMREFNASGKGRVEFTGFDMQTPTVAIRTVRDFVAQRDPGYAESVTAAAALVGSPGQAQGSFGVINYNLAATAWAKKKLRLAGSIRTENVTQGQAHLWLRADGGGKRKAFRNLGGNGVTGTSDWKSYAIEVEVPAETDRVFFGGTFGGTGTAWFDDLTLTVDGQEIALANAGFEKAEMTGFYAGGAGTRVQFDPATFAGGKQSLRLERTAPGASTEPDVRAAVLRWTDVLKHLEAARALYRQNGATSAEVEWAIQNARLVRQCLQMRAGQVSRDESMARNVEWILEQSPKAKIVLWAHNGHLATDRMQGLSPMGGFLRKTYGQSMVAFAFAFHRGSFQAVKQGGSLQDFPVPPAPAGSWDALMGSTGIPRFALDLRQAPAELRLPLKSRTVGAVYSPESADQYLLDVNYPANFDALLFVESTTAARGNKPASFLTATGDGQWLDPQTQVAFKLPAGWSVAATFRNGNESSLQLVQGGKPSGLYYRVEKSPLPQAPEAVEKSLRGAMAAKAAQRQREGIWDYRNVPGSERRHEVNGHPALTWTASYTMNGQPMMESCTYLQSAKTTALFFTKMPAGDLEAFERRIAPIVDSLRVP